MGQGSGQDEDAADLELLHPSAGPGPTGSRQTSLPLEKPSLEFGRPLDAPTRRRNAPAPTVPVDEDKVGDYRHPEASRTNIPEAGLATQDRSIPEKVTFEYRQGDVPPFDPHLDPQLVWAGKAEHQSFEVDTVSLHIHERVSTAAVLRAVRREDVQRTLFSEPQFNLDQELAFYQHEMDWANRLILGDSLLVMNSLLRREGMAGKVQCIYIDPPYGVNYRSNFQPRIDDVQVKDGSDDSLPRQPEEIRAYRDTWTLGIHSYLNFLRDRLLLSRELLAEHGSVFLQISQDNLHTVRAVLDEVFGGASFVAIIPFRKKTMPLGTKFIEQMDDFILWYARSGGDAKYRSLYRPQSVEGDWHYQWAVMPDGTTIRLSRDQVRNHALLPKGARLFMLKSLEPSGPMPSGRFEFEFGGRMYPPPKNGYGTTRAGLEALKAAGRLAVDGNRLAYKLFADEVAFTPLTAPWNDTIGPRDKVYVVQTSHEVVERCVLMTTDPGDLVLDPTCGSGTTAFVCEKWGRRWITCDTSRVALALARQRLMTASFEYYELVDSGLGVDAGLRYREIERATLGSISRAESIPRITLYDQPLVDRSKARVSGPFTVEQIPSFGIDDTEDLYEPDALGEADRPDDLRHRGESDPVRSIGELVDLLRIDGVRLPGGRKLDFLSLVPTVDGGQIHAEGEFEEAGERRRIAVSFGPLHGPISARQVEDVLREVSFAPNHAILFAGFAIDGSAQQLVQNYRTPKNLTLLMANIAADVLVPDLLKSKRGQQLFAVFGEPDVTVRGVGADEFEVTVRGMDVYDPTTGEVTSDSTDQIAAWFLDQDYDRRSFLISQAFFPGAGSADPWQRLSRALKGWVDPDAFEMLRGTVSLPFRAGQERRVAVKVIDFRGNEAIRIVDLP